MPYISVDDQAKYETDISYLVDKLANSVGTDETVAGHLEYVIFELLHRLSMTDHRRFRKMNELVGVLETTKAEFLRRILGPYEDLKLVDNWSDKT